MPSFEYDIGSQSRAGARFIGRVRDELRRAVFTEKSERKITQQQIADKVGTSRFVINRQIQGLENMTLRSVAEILWAIGWEPHFEARKMPAGENQYPPESASGVKVVNATATTSSGSRNLSDSPYLSWKAAM